MHQLGSMVCEDCGTPSEDLDSLRSPTHLECSCQGKAPSAPTSGNPLSIGAVVVVVGRFPLYWWGTLVIPTHMFRLQWRDSEATVVQPSPDCLTGFASVSHPRWCETHTNVDGKHWQTLSNNQAGLKVVVEGQ